MRQLYLQRRLSLCKSLSFFILEHVSSVFILSKQALAGKADLCEFVITSSPEASWSCSWGEGGMGNKVWRPRMGGAPLGLPGYSQEVSLFPAPGRDV